MTSIRKITLLLLALASAYGAFAQSSELTQYWNGQRADNFLAATKDGNAAAKNAGYITIRSEGFLSTEQTSGFVPLYLYYNVATTDNFSSNTASPPAGYRKIRLQGYVAQNPGSGFVPLKVYYSPSRKDYMTLSHPTSESAAKGAGYQLIGIVGYVGQTASSIQGQSNSGGMITVAEIKTIEKINNSTGKQESIAGTMQAAKIDDISKLIINRAMVKSAEKVYFSPAESPIFDIEPPVKSQAVNIGRGYNSLLKDPKLPALESIAQQDIQRLHVNNVRESHNYARSLEDYYKHLGVDVRASGSYLFVSGSSRTKFEKNTESHRFNESYVGFIEMETFLEYTTLENLKLNQTAMDVLKNQGINSFYQQYGDCFIMSIQYGAGLRAATSYELYKSSEQVTFSNDTKLNVNGLAWSANLSIKVDSETRKNKENESRSITIDSYGATFKGPQSIDELKDVISNFRYKAELFAGQSNSQEKYGGVLLYTVMKYSNLPEFQQIAGGPDKLNLNKQRALLDQLTYYRRKLNRMRSNLLYIQKQPNEFKTEDVKASTTSLSQVDQYLQAIDKDISIVQQFPFDQQRLANINVKQYEQMPDLAPSSHFVRVELNFPAEQTQVTSTKSYWLDHAGPLIGYNIVNGNGEAGGRYIDINIHSNLTIRNNGTEAYLKQDFLLHENNSDHSKIQGTKSLKVYQAPENYKVIGFKKASEEYFLRDLHAIHPNVPVLFDVNGTMRDDRIHFKNGPINDPLWVDLNVIFGNDGSDQDYVGLFGRMVIYVEIQEVAPKI